MAESAKSNPILFAQAFGGNEGAKQIARALGPGFFEAFNQVSDAVAADIANPAMSGLALNFQTATDGLVGAMNENKASLDKVKDAVGNQMVPAIEAMTNVFLASALKTQLEGGGLLGTATEKGLIANFIVDSFSAAMDRAGLALGVKSQAEVDAIRAGRDEDIKRMELQIQVRGEGGATGEVTGVNANFPLGEQAVTEN